MKNKIMSLAENSLRLCHMFEGELLVELMLRHWKHPYAIDSDYRNDLLERTVDVLNASVNGEVLMEELPPSEMNLVAAVWYAESVGLQSASSEIDESERDQREAWLSAVRQTIPSCFCKQEDLSE